MFCLLSEATNSFPNLFKYFALQNSVIIIDEILTCELQLLKEKLDCVRLYEEASATKTNKIVFEFSSEKDLK